MNRPLKKSNCNKFAPRRSLRVEMLENRTLLAAQLFCTDADLFEAPTAQALPVDALQPLTDQVEGRTTERGHRSHAESSLSESQSTRPSARHRHELPVLGGLVAEGEGPAEGEAPTRQIETGRGSSVPRLVPGDPPNVRQPIGVQTGRPIASVNQPAPQPPSSVPPTVNNSTVRPPTNPSTHSEGTASTNPPRSLQSPSLSELTSLSAQSSDSVFEVDFQTVSMRPAMDSPLMLSQSLWRITELSSQDLDLLEDARVQRAQSSVDQTFNQFVTLDGQLEELQNLDPYMLWMHQGTNGLGDADGQTLLPTTSYLVSEGQSLPPQVVDSLVLSGMLALELPEDLLPTRDRAGAIGGDEIEAWTSRIGVYRDGDFAITNGRKALAMQPIESTRAADLSAQQEPMREIPAWRLRLLLAATTSTLGAIFIGTRRQRKHDQRVRESFAKLQ